MQVEEQAAPAVDQVAFRFVEELSRDLNRGRIELPAFPDIALKVKRVLEDENSTLDQIGRVIGAEPGLAARVLKMANSAMCNRSGKAIVDVPRAIARLGHDRLRSLAVSFAMQNMMSGRTAAALKPHLDALWRHSIEVAAIAQSLAANVDGVDEDAAMFVGLVHDIGKLYIFTKVEGHPELFDSESSLTAILADWHAQIGRAILESWEFDASVVEAVCVHEDTDRSAAEASGLDDVLIAANVLARALSDDTLDELDVDALPSCRRVGVSAQSLDAVMARAREEIAEMTSVLNA